MNATQADGLIAMLSGYWPSPALSDDEGAAWMVTLTRGARFTVDEARSVLVACAENGDKWRPRAGEFVAMVQHQRRQRALRTPQGALPSGEKVAGKDDHLRGLAECRRLMGIAR